VAAHQNRLALALNIDQATRIFVNSILTPKPSLPTSTPSRYKPIVWQDMSWRREDGSDCM
jgi:hypothetical protein